MVVGKEDLGLSLSLSCNNPTNTTTITTTNNNNNNNHNINHNNMGFFMMMNKNNNHNHNQTTPSINTNNNNVVSTPLQLNLMMTSPSLPSPVAPSLPWHRPLDSFPHPDRTVLRGIDVNRPSGGGGVSGEDEAGVSSPNSTVSTASGKRSSSERDGDEIELERASSRGMSDDEDGGENSRKKLRLSKDQSAILEESFKEHSTLNPKQKQALAKRLGLRARQVEVWFQNRRARTKLKQTEVDCEFLKGCCEKLTEENRRLQKEVHELRTLKLSPQFYMQMTPPTTLTMCPSCERVATAQAQPQAGLDSKPNVRPMPVNLWGGAPVPVPVSVRPLPFDVFRPQS